jgi:UDP-glucose 4-epimerase
MTWLLTGGAGYIGGHVGRALQASGREVVVLDDLSTGLAERTEGVPLITASILDEPDRLAAVMREHQVTGLVHLAAKKAVPESMQHPLHYYEQNVSGTVHLLRAAVRAGVRHVLYSSTAAVYGETGGGLVDEDHPTVPTNPYGESKLAAEWLVRRVAEAHGLSWTALRYFNVAGAADARLADRGVFNLLPIVLRQRDAGRPVDVFGGDWPTPDGSCVRDYVHVEDLAEAHVASAAGLEDGGVTGRVFNVGRGVGVSVLELISAVERAVGGAVPYRIVGRRPGDPPSVVADASRIAAELGWRATRGVDEIARSAWNAWTPSAAVQA